MVPASKAILQFPENMALKISAGVTSRSIGGLLCGLLGLTHHGRYAVQRPTAVEHGTSVGFPIG